MARLPQLVRVSLAVALFAAILPAAGAADTWPVPRGPSHEPEPFQFDASKPPAVPAEFLDDAVACVLYAGNSHLVEPDGTVETITHEVTRLAGRKGVEKLGEYRNIAFEPSFQKLTLNEARIHKANGRIVPVQPRHVQLRDVGTDYQVYDREKQLIISFPSLEVGDVIEVKWTVRGRNPEHGGHFFTRYSFGDPQFPVLIDEFRVRLPRGRTFKHAVIAGKITPVRAEQGEWVNYLWRATNCKRLPQDENPPSRETLRPSLACSTFASWDEVARWKQRLRADCWDCTPEVRALVAQVTRGLDSPLDKARALTLWMRQKIRYISAGEKHDYTPHLPGEVLANRFGDCKDSSQLLAVLLREAGIPVALATLGALDDGQILEDVPSPWGTHAILLAIIAGNEHWIDTTSSLAGWDFLPRDDRDRLCYLVDDKGVLTLKRTPPASARDNRVMQVTYVHVGADGSSRCERQAVHYGSAAMAQRDTFLEVPAGERRRQVTAELQDSNSRTRLARLHVDERALRDFDRPASIQTTFEIPGHFTGTTEREGSLSDSKVWGRLLAFTLDYERTLPLNLGSPFELGHRFKVQLPPAFVLDSVPHDREVRSAWGVFTRSVRTVDSDDPVREVEIEFHTRIDHPLVEPADFDAFRQFHEEVSQVYRIWLTLRPAEDLDDAPALEAVLRWAPDDTASAATLARLYLKHHLDSDARRVLARALHFHPEDATLQELRVKAAADPKEEESALRELARRFPEEPRYALDLAAFLISAGHQKEAREILEPLTRGGPSSQRANAHFQLARSHYRRDELEKALAELKKAESADAEAVHTVRACVLRGNVLEELGRPAHAARAYEAALAIDREAELPLQCLTRLALVINDRDKAVEYLRRYIVAVGDDSSGLLQAAEFCLRLERWEEALDLAKHAGGKAISPRAHRILGLAHWHRGNLDAAVEHLAKGDKDAAALEALLAVSLLRGDLSSVPALMREADRVEKPTADLRRTAERASALLRRRLRFGQEVAAPKGKEKEWAAALDAVICGEEARNMAAPPQQIKDLLERALASGLEVGPAFALRGRLALDRGKLQAALADAERAVRLTPTCAGGYYVRGLVRLERRMIGAVEDLEKAAILSGRADPEVLHALADALFQAGRVPEALATQKEAVKLKPKDKEMVEQLGRFEKAGGHGGVRN
jgi:tetratricopeptide (TPR) repeat protein